MMHPDCLPKHIQRDMTAVMAMDALMGIPGNVVLEIALARLEWNGDASVGALRKASRDLDRAADQKERNQ